MSLSNIMPHDLAVSLLGWLVLIIYLLQRGLVVVFVTPKNKSVIVSDYQSVDRDIEV